MHNCTTIFHILLNLCWGTPFSRVFDFKFCLCCQHWEQSFFLSASQAETKDICHFAKKLIRSLLSFWLSPAWLEMGLVVSVAAYNKTKEDLTNSFTAPHSSPEREQVGGPLSSHPDQSRSKTSQWQRKQIMVVAMVSTSQAVSMLERHQTRSYRSP